MYSKLLVLRYPGTMDVPDFVCVHIRDFLLTYQDIFYVLYTMYFCIDNSFLPVSLFLSIELKKYAKI